jgi:acetylornithine deacetylase/succinyl-diaminopimelate desuccinylase-like protein
MWSSVEVALMRSNFVRSLSGFALSLIISASSFLCPGVEAASLSQEKAGAEAADLLAHYLQVDTTNPPGNEKLGADYLASILRKEGLKAEVITTGVASRACVYARLKGNGKKKGIVLLNHIDVVPAQAKDWQYPPFSGQIHDGELWGRGALDMKGEGIAQLEAMLQLKRRGVVLDRDIVFLATPDEEVGGQHGAGWVKKNRPDLVQGCEFLLNEGASIDVDASGKTDYWGVDIAEKSVLWLKVTAKGDASHASVPIKDSAPNRLVRALNRLVDAPTELSILPVVQQYFTAIAPIAPPELKSAYLDLTAASKKDDQVELLMKDKIKAAMLRNTVSLTVLKGGYKTNVIPAEASAELDCRLLPGVKSEDFIAHIKQILKDDSLKIEVLDFVTAIPSSEKSLLFDAIKQVAGDEAKAAHIATAPPVVPVVVGWFTDSHWFRELGLTAYGFEPFDLDKTHLSSVHGKNERIPLSTLTKGVHRFEQILLKLSQ